MIIEDYQGQPIRLPDERWEHIISPSHSHMAAMRELVVKTLQDPDVVSKSNNDPDTVNLYYKWFDSTAVGERWVCVVVKFLDDGDAFVMTAYATSQIREGEEIWRSGQE